MRLREFVAEEESTAIARTAQDLVNPPVKMQHRARRDQEREQTYQNAQRGRDDDDDLDEGASNLGARIKTAYKKIYDAGDDAIEFAYNDSPIFAQYWDEYEGDLDSIIAEVDASELQIILDELEAAAEDQGVAEGSLNEFAPPGSSDGGDDGFSEETLKRLAAQWYNGDEDPRVERTLMAAGWEIGQDEGYDNEPGVFVVQAGDVNGNSYMSWPAHELQQGVAEGWTKLPSGDYQNSHTGVRTSKPPVKKKRSEKTGAEWDAIEKAKQDKEQGVAEGSGSGYTYKDTDEGTYITNTMGETLCVPYVSLQDQGFKQGDRRLPEVWQMNLEMADETGAYIVDDEQGVAEMDSQQPQGRYKSDGTRSHSTYGNRDIYTLGDPETTVGPDSVLTAKDAAKKAGKELDKAFDKSHKKGMAEAKKANTATARAELGKRPRKEDPIEQDKKKKESDAAWERLMQFAADQKKDVAEAQKEADYGPDYQDMVARVKKLAGLGPLKTVWDEKKRVYKNVPVAVQPAQQPKKDRQ